MGELVPVLMSEKIIIPLMGKQSRAGSCLSVGQTRRAAHKLRGERSDQPVTRRCAPGIRWWGAPVRCATPRGKENRGDKSENEAALWSSSRVPARMQITIPCVLLAVCLERKTRAETAAPWRPDARCKQLCPRLGGVRLCADYRLPPPLASPIISESITARLSQQHTGRVDWQQGRTFALFLHCKNVLFATESRLKSAHELSGEHKVFQKSEITLLVYSPSRSTAD